MSTALVITSGKGGVGKTTSSANIGTALALQNQRVVIVDLDIGLRNLDTVLGLENRVIYDIVDVVEGRAKLAQALIKDKRFDDNLYLLPAAQNADKDILNPEDVQTVVAQLKENFDFVILDCPAGIESGFKNAVGAADGAIVIATPEISSVSDADRVVGLLDNYEMKLQPRLVINRIRTKMMNEGDTMDVDEITKHLSISLLGIVFDDDAVIKTSNKGTPIVLDPNSPASQGYRNIARRLLGQTVPLMSIKTKKTSFWSKIFKR